VLGLLLLLLMGLSIALWTSPYAARARDVRFGLRYTLGIWYFLTPVIYPLGAIPSTFEVLARLNPATAPIELVKFGLFGTGKVPYTSLWVTLAFSAVVAGGGMWFFGRHEEAAADAF
jgi:lipopolysaccharide transport system permease protein